VVVALTGAEVTRLNKWTLQDEARLVVVVDLLWRVGEGAGYKVLIVDEAGLVRRHFVGATLAGGTKAAEAYDMVKASCREGEQGAFAAGRVGARGCWFLHLLHMS
jgi:hypothetical protein